ELTGAVGRDVDHRALDLRGQLGEAHRPVRDLSGADGVRIDLRVRGRAREIAAHRGVTSRRRNRDVYLVAAGVVRDGERDPRALDQVQVAARSDQRAAFLD